jgi:paraquat-inducible protein B
MNNDNDLATAADTLPSAVVAHKSRFSIVWLVPIVAALIGAWLVYRALTESGPTITIDFDTGAGLVAGKTKIRFKDVEVGHVNSVELKKDLSGVRVTAEMSPNAKGYLTDQTRFWVVRARLAAGEVSGLGTLLSGAYIGMDPSTDGEKAREFIGLKKAPVIEADTPGKQFSLRADTLGSIDIGAPIYFRQIRVGRVLNYEMNAAGTIEAEIFVEAPHDARVKTTTRFWNAGGIDVTLNADGLQVDSESLVTMLVGGIAFETPPGLADAGEASAGTTFHLYENRRASESPVYDLKRYMEVIFNNSIRGLSVGAPVEMLGFELGSVVDIKPQELLSDTQELLSDTGVSVRVLLEIEPERYPDLMADTNQQARANLDRMVANGLRAKLATGSLITGQKMIALDFFPKAPEASIDYSGEYPVIPTMPGSIAEIAESFASIAQQLDNVPFEQLGTDLGRTASGLAELVNSSEVKNALRDLSASLEQLRAMSSDLNETVSPALTNVMAEAEQTLASVRTMVDTNSAARNEVRRLLIELTETAQAIRMIADYLERHPEALIRGKGD